MATARFLVAVSCVLALVRSQDMPPAEQLACSGCEVVVRRIMFDLEQFEQAQVLHRQGHEAEQIFKNACPRLPTKTAVVQKPTGGWMYAGPKLAKQTSKFKTVIDRPEEVKAGLKTFCEKLLKDHWDDAVTHTTQNWGLNLRNRMCFHWSKSCPNETPMQPRKFATGKEKHPDQAFHPEWGIPIAGDFEAPPPNLHEWTQVGPEGVHVEL